MELEERRRPYAAAANVIAVLERIRSRNMPEKVNDDFLRIAGISEIVFGRVLEALRFLAFVEDDGTPTSILHSVGGAPEKEYREILEGAIRDAYREDFAKIDPAQDSQAQIIDAFKPYQPRSQTSRMVMLFLGICREAGIPVLEAPRQRAMTGPSKPKRQSSTTTRRQTGSNARQSANRGNGVDPKPLINSGLVFGVSESDIAALPDEEFDEVWTALGKVARARALRDAAPQTPMPSDTDLLDEEGDDL